MLELIAEGRSNQAIGARLFLSPKTVETHIHQIFQKLDLVVDRPTHTAACSRCSPSYGPEPGLTLATTKACPDVPPLAAS